MVVVLLNAHMDRNCEVCRGLPNVFVLLEVVAEEPFPDHFDRPYRSFVTRISAEYLEAARSNEWANIYFIGRFYILIVLSKGARNKDGRRRLHQCSRHEGLMTL
jgi:hypothetical protein